MNVAIAGYGKMGKLIRQFSEQRGHSVSAIIDSSEDAATARRMDRESVEKADVIIEFTHPDSAVANIKKAAELGKNIVVGTTGWYERLGEAKKIAEDSGIGLLHSPNFSVGVGIFLRIVEEASRLMDKAPEYDAFGYEMHHNQKADSPSGTARAVAETMLGRISRKNEIVYEKLGRKIEPRELHYASVRAGSMPGTHAAAFDSEADSIEIKHVARSRKGFALGAVMAAEWLEGRKGFFGMEDFVEDFFRQKKRRG